MASEKLFENRLKKWLESHGIYAAGTPQDKKDEPECGWFFKVWGGGYQKSGIPDIIMCVNGFFLAVELKSETGKPSELQQKNVCAINNSNGIAIILYPDGFDQFKDIVKGCIKCSHHIQGLLALKAVNSSTSCDILTEYRP